MRGEKFCKLKNPGNFYFPKKIKVTIKPGIYQGPIQAFTALCSTKIVAATDRGVWGKNLQKMREINHGNFHPKHASL